MWNPGDLHNMPYNLEIGSTHAIDCRDGKYNLTRGHPIWPNLLNNRVGFDFENQTQSGFGFYAYLARTQPVSIYNITKKI